MMCRRWEDVQETKNLGRLDMEIARENGSFDECCRNAAQETQ